MKYCLFFNNRKHSEPMTGDFIYVLLEDWEG